MALQPELLNENITEKTRVTDITVCLGVRLHDDNPWIFDRLALQLIHYNPRPSFIIADLGSNLPYRKQLQALCADHGAEYVFDDYTGVYSASRAHNLAAKAANTPLLFFADPDFFSSSDLFSRLISILNNTGMHSRLDLMINLPVFHLGEKSTRYFLNMRSSETRSAALDRIKITTFGKIGKAVDFVAPYSNVFLCHKDGFNLTGGYDESFSGHGSEDFEFLLRFNCIMDLFPMPESPASDIYQPYSNDFYCQRDYSGFRRLFEAMSFSAETFGLSAFHLHHDKLENNEWLIQNDWQRENFQSRVMPYLENYAEILRHDWGNRSTNTLVLLPEPQNTDFFLPLRLVGHHLFPIYDRDLNNTTELNNLIKNIDAVTFIDGSTRYSSLITTAQKLGKHVIRIHQGTLLNSWQYTCDDEPNADTLTDIHLRSSSNILAEETTALLLRSGYSLIAENGNGKQCLYHLCFPGIGKKIWSRGAMKEKAGARSYIFARLGMLSAEQLQRIAERAKDTPFKKINLLGRIIRKLRIFVKYLGSIP